MQKVKVISVPVAIAPPQVSANLVNDPRIAALLMPPRRAPHPVGSIKITS